MGSERSILYKAAILRQPSDVLLSCRMLWHPVRSGEIVQLGRDQACVELIHGSLYKADTVL